MDVLRLVFWFTLFSVLLCCSACTGIFFQPDADMPYRPVQFHLNHQIHTIPVETGVSLQAWLLRTKSTWATVLYLHGNSGNISADLGQIAWLPSYGVQVFSYDYRGYGRSDGVPNVQTSIADFQQVLAYVSKQPDVSGKPLFVFGQSLGGALAIHALAESPLQARVCGLITEGAFSSYRGVARDHFAANWITWPLQKPLAQLFATRYDPLAGVSDLATPWFIIHGDADPVVPVRHAQRLYQAAAKPKAFWSIPHGGHVNQSNRLEYREKIVAFLRDYGANGACLNPTRLSFETNLKE